MSIRPATRRRLAAALATLGPAACHAGTTLIWMGGAGDWSSTATNWSDGSASIAWPAPASDGASDVTAYFYSAGDRVTLAEDVTVHRLEFATGVYTLASANNASLILASNSAAVAPAINVYYGQTAEIAAPIAGSSNWSNTGSGTLVLSGNSTFTGALTLTTGTVRATTQASALGAGSLAFDASFYGATLELANDTGLAFGRAVDVAGTANFVSDRLTTGAGVTHALGNLATRNAFITLNAGSYVGSGVAGLTFGHTTVADYATFQTAANTTLTLASLDTQNGFVTFRGAGSAAITGALSSTNDNFAFQKSGPGSLSLGAGSHTIESFYQTGGTFLVEDGVIAGKRADIAGAGSATTLTGPDARWTLREDLFIAGNATTPATLTVSGRAALSATTINLGDYNGNAGEILVTGANSRLTDTAAPGYYGLLMGSNGPGSLAIRDGGAVTSSTVVVGYSGPGTVQLAGVDSSWTVNGRLTFGYTTGGTGSLTVSDGATGTSLSDFSLGYVGGTGSLTIRDSGSKWTALNGIGLNAGEIILRDGGTLQLGANADGYLSVASGSTLRIGVGGASGILSGAYIGVSGSLIFNHSDDLAFGPRIVSGSGSISKQGAGTLTLATDNIGFTGAIIVSGGTLRATSSENALGYDASTLTLAGGNLALANNTSLLLGRNTTITADATIAVDRTSAASTGVTHTLGTLSLDDNTLSTARGSNITGAGVAGLTFGATTLSANGATFDTAANTVLTLGALSGNFSFEKKGSGQLTLGTASARSGAATTVSAGTLRLTNANALGTTAQTLNLNGGALQLAANTSSTFSGTNIVLGGNASVTADRTTSAATSTTHTLGTLSLGANTLSTTRGANITGAGVAGLTFGATTLSANGATFDTAASTTLTLGALSGNFSFEKKGSGQLTLGTASTRSDAATTVSAGTLRLTNANALGTTAQTLNLNGGTLLLANNTGSAFNGTNVFLGGNATVTADRTTSATTSTTHTLGTLSLGANTLSTARGANITGTGVAGLTFGATTLSANGATFDTGANTTLTLGGIGETGTAARGFTKSGAGTLVLSGAGTFSGDVNLSAGSLLLGHDSALGTGALTLGASTSLGTSGSRTIANNIQLAANAGLNAQIAPAASLTLNGVIGGASGTGFDKFGSGSLTLGGANTFSGAANLYAGTVIVAHDQAFGTGNIELKGASLQGDGTARTLANALYVNVATTLGGASDLTFTGKAVNLLTTNTLTVNNTGRTTFSGDFDLGAASNATLTFATGTGADVRLSGVVANGVNATAGRLTKSGVGTLTLSAENTYGGLTTVSAGTLVITRDKALGTAAAGTTVNNGGTIALQGGFTYSTAEALTLNTSTTGGLSNLSGDNSFAGPITVSGVSRYLVAGGSRLTLAGVVSGTPATSLRNGGTLVLANSGNTFSGSLAVNDGTLLATANGALGGTSGQINVNSGGTLALSGGINYASAKPITLIGNGATGRNGALDNLSGDNTFAGPITLSDPVARLGAAAGTTLTLSGAIGHAVTGWGPTFAGPGTIKLTAANTYSGPTTLVGGTVEFSTLANLGAGTGVTFNGGALRYASGNTADLSARTVTLQSGGATIDTNGNTVAFASTIGAGGSGALTKLGSGTLTLSAANTYTGGTFVNGGTLAAGHVSAFGSGPVVVNPGAILDLGGFSIANTLDVRGGTLSGLASFAGTQTVAGATTYSGTVGGALVVASGGAINTTGATFTGPVTVQSGGVLAGTGTLGTVVIASGGTLSPGNSPGLLTINGDLTLSAGSSALFEINGLARGLNPGYDAANISGALTAGGTLTVVFIDGYTPAGPATFDLLNFSSFGGSFAQVNLPAIGGYTWNTSQLSIDGSISLVASAIPEPSTFAALAGLAGLAATAARRPRRTREA